MVRARDEVGVAERAIVLANPLPPAEQLDPELHDRVLAAGLERAALEGVAGKDVTPFLLDLFHSETGGASLEANVRLVLRNAALAARVAVALAPHDARRRARRRHGRRRDAAVRPGRAGQRLARADRIRGRRAGCQHGRLAGAWRARRWRSSRGSARTRRAGRRVAELEAARRRGARRRSTASGRPGRASCSLRRTASGRCSPMPGANDGAGAGRPAR